MKNILISDHKTGHTLSRLYTKIINDYIKDCIEFRYCYLFWNFYKPDEKYVIIIRDPREIIISGYLYHKMCSEIWCINKNGNYYEGWNKNHFLKEEMVRNDKYIKEAMNFSSKMSYQNKLRILPQEDGIIHEMNSVAKLTIMGMYNLIHYEKKNVLIFHLEDFTFNFEKTIEKLCKFYNIEKNFIEKIIAKAADHNLLNYQKKNKDLPWISTNKNLINNRYKNYWTNNIQKEFESLFPKDLLSKFNLI
jgi:hypothetical protein|tara:strand:+ start:393 stop:1136 length:744 start_codon:yes stop_codon:yes gene_type:complete